MYGYCADEAIYDIPDWEDYEAERARHKRLIDKDLHGYEEADDRWAEREMETFRCGR